MLDFLLLIEYDLIHMSILKIIPSICSLLIVHERQPDDKERNEMLINQLIRLIDK